MMYILSILVLIYAMKAFYVYKLRQKRNSIDFTTKEGKYDIVRINNLIDFLNGTWLWKKSKYRKRK